MFNLFGLSSSPIQCLASNASAAKPIEFWFVLYLSHNFKREVSMCWNPYKISCRGWSFKGSYFSYFFHSLFFSFLLFEFFRPHPPLRLDRTRDLLIHILCCTILYVAEMAESSTCCGRTSDSRVGICTTIMKFDMLCLEYE